MSTYEEIQHAVKAAAGFLPKTCWVAHVLSDHGRARRVAPNRISVSERRHPCPADKRVSIETVLREHRML